MGDPPPASAGTALGRPDRWTRGSAAMRPDVPGGASAPAPARHTVRGGGMPALPARSMGVPCTSGLRSLGPPLPKAATTESASTASTEGVVGSGAPVGERAMRSACAVGSTEGRCRSRAWVWPNRASIRTDPRANSAAPAAAALRCRKAKSLDRSTAAISEVISIRLGVAPPGAAGASTFSIGGAVEGSSSPDRDLASAWARSSAGDASGRSRGRAGRLGRGDQRGTAASTGSSTSCRSTIPAAVTSRTMAATRVSNCEGASAGGGASGGTILASGRARCMGSYRLNSVSGNGVSPRRSRSVRRSSTGSTGSGNRSLSAGSASSGRSTSCSTGSISTGSTSDCSGDSVSTGFSKLWTDRGWSGWCQS